MSAWRIGTRGSALALWQANTVKARLEALGVPPCEVVVIKTDGDRLQDNTRGESWRHRRGVRWLVVQRG